MRVIYKKTILDKIREAAKAAQLARREIEKFVVTAEEAEEIKRECFSGIVNPDWPWFEYGKLPRNTKVMDFRIETE